VRRLLILVLALSLPSLVFASAITQPRIPAGPAVIVDELNVPVLDEDGTYIHEEAGGSERTPITIPRNPRL